MKIGMIELASDFARAGAAISVLLAVTVSMSATACSLFGSEPVRETVVPRTAAKNTDPYVIGSDDEIEIVFWNQPQLSGKVIVASDGTIAMPLIGRVPAAGQTPDQLKADLEKRYARYVHATNATVRVTDPASRVFYVLGEVSRPGVYRLHSGEVLSQ